MASVHVDSQPCAEILSWCLSHVVGLCTSLHDFYGPWSDPSATSLAHTVCQCNRQVLHKPQHLHLSDPFLLPAMWRRLGSTNSRCMRSHCKSPVKQLRGGVHVRGLYSGFLEVAQILAKTAKKGTSNARQERISTTATCRRLSHVSMLLLGSRLRFRVCRAARNAACRRQARSDGIRGPMMEALARASKCLITSTADIVVVACPQRLRLHTNAMWLAPCGEVKWSMETSRTGSKWTGVWVVDFHM